MSVFKENDYSVASDTAHAFFEVATSAKVLVKVRDAEKEIWSAERGMK